MSAVTLPATTAAEHLSPPRRDWTVDDLAAMPDDGNRHELIDGMLIVSPAPRRRHQRAAARLSVVLQAACPEVLEVFFAPFDVHLALDTLVQPDLLVVPSDEEEEDGTHGPPLLAVEILSPSTRRYDLTLKRSRYEAAGIPAFWVVDPGDADAPPSFVAWELQMSGYVEVARAAGDERAHPRHPFEVEVVPAELVAPRVREPKTR